MDSDAVIMTGDTPSSTVSETQSKTHMQTDNDSHSNAESHSDESEPRTESLVNGDSQSHSDSNIPVHSIQSKEEILQPNQSNELPNDKPAIPNMNWKHKEEAVNGLSDDLSKTQEDELLSELDQAIQANKHEEELSALRQSINKLESTNKYLEMQLKQISDKNTTEIQTLKQTLSDCQTQNEGLQKSVAGQYNEIKMWKERVDSNDKAARKAIEGYKTDHQANIDKITKRYSDCKSEKEAMVVKYAQGEAKIATLLANVDKLEQKVKEKEREKDLLTEKLRSIKSESAKNTSSLGERASELVALKKELETQKENVSSHEYRTKWAQNKLKAELEGHKETKAKLEEMTRRYKESKEESVTIRNNCQDMIKTYQESEEIKSNSLDIELKKKSKELEEAQTQIDELTQNLEASRSELNKLKNETDILRKQSGAGEVKVEELEKTNTQKLKELEDLNSCIQSLREENSQIRNRLKEMQHLQHDLETKTQECGDLENQLSTLDQTYQESLSEMAVCKQRQNEMLQLTQKMTERNTELQSENSGLKSKLSGIAITSNQQDNQIKHLEDTVKHKESALLKEKATLQSDLDNANTRLEQLDKTVEKLNLQIEEHQTEIKTLKKKQTSSVKELTREVHTLRRQLEAYENKHSEDPSAVRQNSPARAGSAPVSLQHSRTNSTSSLDKPDGWVIVNQQQRQASPENTRDNSKISRPAETMEAPPTDQLEPQFLEPDKQRLIEKIVKLQRAHARKNEKLDFCEDHIKQLVEEVQRKTRIIQMYVMKEEGGTLSSDSMDRNKSTIAKKGGIMASISNQHSNDGRMSLDLSLQINHKLQAVLEDTLIKNITLKENMDTLGNEISRISTENAKLSQQINCLVKAPS